MGAGLFISYLMNKREQVSLPATPVDPVSLYYAGIDDLATNEELKLQLKELLSDKTVITYGGAWDAFKEMGKFLPGYPCSEDLDQIPDIYSDYCWTTEKN